MTTLIKRNLEEMKKLVLFIAATFLFVGLMAQTSTVSSGNWTNAGNWTAGVPGDELAQVNNAMNLNTTLNIGNGADYRINADVTDPSGGAAYSINQSGTSIVDIDARVEIEGNYSLSNSSSLTVRSGDTLIIRGNLTATQSSVITVEAGGVLIIDGDLSLNQSTLFNVDGNLVVGGDVEARNSSGMAGSGNLEVGGTVDIRNGSTIFGSTSDCPTSPCEYGSGAGLPIKLISMEANAVKSNVIKVDWTTASEINNDYFIIEVSLDGSNYIELGRESGAGNSYKKLDYSMLKELPFNESAELIYVKLSQFDFDGATESFDPVVVRMNEHDAAAIDQFKFSAYPNPGKGHLINLKSERMPAANYNLQLLSTSGQLIQQESISISENQNFFQYQLSINRSLEKGIYILRLSDGNENYILKYMVQ